MKVYNLLFNEYSFVSKEGNKWRTPIIDLYYNGQYKNYSIRKSQFGTNLLGNGTYTGANAVSDIESDIGINENDRFIDMSGRIDISSAEINISNTNLNFPATIAVYASDDPHATPYFHESEDFTGAIDWLKAEHRNPRYPIGMVNCDRYVFFEIDFNSEYDTSDLQVELIVTVKIDSPIIDHYFQGTKKIQNKFPEWMALREYDALDEQKATPQTPETIGGKFINASMGEWLTDIDKRLNLLTYNHYIDTVDTNAKIWVYKTLAVPERIYDILGVIDQSTGQNVELARSTDTAEFYESYVTEDVFFHNTISGEIYCNKKYDILYINGVEYPQISHQLWSPLDDIGATVDLFRLQQEDNHSFKKRILDVFINKPGVSIKGFKNALRRELNLWKYSGATPATPDSYFVGATPEILEIKDLENDLEYFVNKIPTQKFLTLAEELATKYPLLWGYLQLEKSLWDPDGVNHTDFGVIPRQLDATPISSEYIESGVIDGNDLFVFTPDQFTGSQDFTAKLKLRGAKKVPLTIKPRIDFSIAVYGTGTSASYVNPRVEENITIQVTLTDGSRYYYNTVISGADDRSAKYPSGTGNAISTLNWVASDGYTQANCQFYDMSTGSAYGGRINLANVEAIELIAGHFSGNINSATYSTKADISTFKLWFQYDPQQFIGGDIASPSTSISLISLQSFNIRSIYPTICFQSLASYEEVTPRTWTSDVKRTYDITLNNDAEGIGKNFVLTLPKDIVWPNYVSNKNYIIEITNDINALGVGTNSIVSDVVDSNPFVYYLNDIKANNLHTWINGIQLFDVSTNEITFSYDKDFETYKWELFEATQTLSSLSGQVNEFGPWRNDEQPNENNKDFLLTRIDLSRNDFNIINNTSAPANWNYSDEYMVTWVGIDSIDNDNVLVWLGSNSVYPLVYDGNIYNREAPQPGQIQEIFSNEVYQYGLIPIYARLRPGVNAKWSPKLHSGWFFDTDETYYLYADGVTENATTNSIVLSGTNRLGAPIIVHALNGGTPVSHMRQVAFYGNDATPELSLINKEIFKGHGGKTFILAYKDIYNITVYNSTLGEYVNVLSPSSSTNEVILSNNSNSDFTYEISYKVRESFYANNNYVDENGNIKTQVVFDSTPQSFGASAYEISYETSLFDVATPVDISLNPLYSSINESFIYIDKNTYPLSQIEVRVSQSKILADGIDYALITFRSIDTNGNPKPFTTFNVYTNFGYINPSTITTDKDGFAWTILKSEPWASTLHPTPSHVSLPIPQIGATPVHGMLLIDGDLDANISYQIDIPIDKQRYIAAIADPNQISSNTSSAVFVTGVVRSANHTPLANAIVYWRKARTIYDVLSSNELINVETDLTQDGANPYGYVVSNDEGYFNIGPFKASSDPGYWFVSTQVGAASPNFNADEFPLIGDIVYWYEHPHNSVRDTTGGAIQYLIDPDALPDYSPIPLHPISLDEKDWTSESNSTAIVIPGATPNRWGRAYREYDTFNDNLPTFNDAIYSIAVQSDGKIIVVGRFTNYIKRLNSDGTEDTDFNSVVSLIFNNEINSVIIQRDEKILVGGTFTGYIKRLNKDGTVDSSFNNASVGLFDYPILALGQQQNGKIIAVGSFTNCVKRLNIDGTLDNSFNANLTYEAWCVALQQDGKILVGGDIDGQITRVNDDGTEDTAFKTLVAQSSINGTVSSIVVQRDGKILVAGYFQKGIKRLNASGSLDNSFTSSLNEYVTKIAIQSNGKILANSSPMRLLNPDGSQDPLFTASIYGTINSPNTVYDVYVQSDGKILIAGSFAEAIKRLDYDNRVITEDRPALGNWTPPLWYAINRFKQYQIGLNDLKLGTNQSGLDVLPATPLYPGYKEF
jgi:hypothetical protein